MRFRFKGDGDLDSEGVAKPTTAFGVTFEPGVWVTDPDLTEAQARKLGSNPAFDAEGAPGAIVQVEIPGDWDKLPWMAKKALAARIQTVPDKAKKADVHAIIEAEIARRAPEGDPEEDDA